MICNQRTAQAARDDTSATALAAPPPDWHADPRLPCKRDPDAWYPATKGDAERVAEVCRTRCPRLVECREQALAEGETWGVWGGMTAAARIEELRARGVKPARRCGHPASDLRQRGDGSAWCAGCERVRSRARSTCSVEEVAGRAAVRRERVMAAYAALAPRGLTREQVVAELGMSEAAFRAIYVRARSEGDPRAVPHTAAGRRSAARQAVAS